MKSLPLRKRELLLESDINRQVLQLELGEIRGRVTSFRSGLSHSHWRYLAPLAGILVAWKFRRLGRFLKSGLGLFVLRKVWETLSTSRTPATR